MALSNWDCLAFGEDGNPGDGTLHGSHGESVEIYKNWLYVRDPRMWFEGSPYTRDTIAQVDAGHITLSSFDIVAKRGPQGGIFVLVEYVDYSGDKTIRKYMAGIGCCAYDDNSTRMAEAMGVDLDKYENWVGGSSHGPDGRFYLLSCMEKEGGSKDFTIKMEGNDHLESQFVGVEESTLSEFMIWLEEVSEDFYSPEFKDWFDAVKSKTPKRFNQGDAFFVGTDEAQTRIENGGEEPLIIEKIEEVFAKKEEEWPAPLRELKNKLRDMLKEGEE